MSENNIEFSNIISINNNDNKIKTEKNEFKFVFDKLKNNLDKLQLSIKDIIDKKQFNFKNFLISNMNIQLPVPNKELNKEKNSKINLSNSSINYEDLKNKSSYNFNNKNSYNDFFLKEENDFNIISQNNKIFNKNEIINDNDKDNIITTNKEKEYYSINSDKNINSYVISSFQEHSNTQSENLNSFSNDNNNDLNLNYNYSSFSPNNNNLFIVKTVNNKKYLGKKRNKKKDKDNKNNKN